MKVKFFALLREITGLKETDAFQGATVRELLESLCAKYGRRLEEWVFAPREAQGPRSLSGNVIILVNGRAIEHLAGLETPLKKTDEVAIFPKLAGG
ncbi:MAG: MoaD/ThiS family protein [Firmicutes bacterium]|nr:MoaD/ThiS family protein [Bacillota bacterium]